MDSAGELGGLGTGRPFSVVTSRVGDKGQAKYPGRSMHTTHLPDQLRWKIYSHKRDWNKRTEAPWSDHRTLH